MSYSMSSFLFSILFTLLLFTRVFTHEISKGNELTDENEGKNFNYPTSLHYVHKEKMYDSKDEGDKTPTRKIEVHEIKGSTSDSSVGYLSNDFQRTIPSMMPNTQKDYGYYPNNYQLDGLTFRVNIPGFARIYLPNLPIELPFPNVELPFHTTRMIRNGYYYPDNFEDGSIIRNRKIMRPSSEIDGRIFHMFPTKTSTMAYEDKTWYGDASKKTVKVDP
ncbi:uncharacterized protein LOC107617011 isoform X5 [Arachis ipaensis]|uniref:Uncharacterized protein n=1 Tax=Arachis hypogaea TaxID=3818 RepID=A0A6B9V7J3_ARAHY|nr:uncharacterized protein LOC107617011 isoform X5 [Arachis ipaensis]XP_025680270.1 uncharacterized protein LOC112780143 isoform X4 [Arachis hypogaea]QHN77706.1 uncharacterized protein DS421_19g655040 [Arachis hypogaea]